MTKTTGVLLFGRDNTRKNFVDMAGMRFGRLLVTEAYFRKRGKPYWACICDCGNTSCVERDMLLKGTKSCGCLRTESQILAVTRHGLHKHPLYKIWQGIIARCYYPSLPHYKRYGGCGVIVCDIWKKDFKSFYDWAISNGWKRGLQIDKDIKGNGKLYSPETCSIVTRSQNCRHRKNSKLITFMGETKTLIEWCEIYKMVPGRTNSRLDSGKTMEYCIEHRLDKFGPRLPKKDKK